MLRCTLTPALSHEIVGEGVRKLFRCAQRVEMWAIARLGTGAVPWRSLAGLGLRNIQLTSQLQAMLFPAARTRQCGFGWNS